MNYQETEKKKPVKKEESQKTIAERMLRVIERKRSQWSNPAGGLVKCLLECLGVESF